MRAVVVLFLFVLFLALSLFYIHQYRQDSILKSEDTDSLIFGDLGSPDWRQKGADKLAYLFQAPPGTTTMTLSVEAKLPLWVHNGVLKVAIDDSTGTRQLVSNSCYLTHHSTACSVTSLSIGSTSFMAVLKINDPTFLKEVSWGRAALSITNEGPFFSKSFKRMAIDESAVTDNDKFIHRFLAPATCPLARTVFQTDAPEIVLEFACNLKSSLRRAKLGIKVNGAEYGSVDAFSTEDINFTNVRLPGGLKTVEIINGFVENINLYGTYLRAVYFPSLSHFSIVTGTRNQNQLLVYGDSIACGAGTAYPPFQAWTALLRKKMPHITVDAYGGRRLFDNYKPNPPFKSLIKPFKKIKHPVIWMAIGLNDYYDAVWDAKHFGSAYALLLDTLHRKFPYAKILAQTPIVQKSENANALGSCLDDYRQQIMEAAKARPGYVVPVDGTKILEVGDLGDDGVHPTSNGHLKYAAYVYGVLSKQGWATSLR